MSENGTRTARFEAMRPQLGALAYRMLGSMNDAEDAVQEAWIRLQGADAEAVQNVDAWLTTVVARICASTFAGMYLIWSGSICNFRETGATPSPPPAIAATRPTWTPRNLTLALVSMTRPARSDVNVTGTSDRKVPANSAEDSHIRTEKITTRMSVYHPG